MIRKRISKIFKTNHKVTVDFSSVISVTEEAKILTARSIIEAHKRLESNNIQDYEFKVFSQWGDDGIIQFLINKVNIPFTTFIEFGVQDYTESNTRFLLMNNNWSGFIMDGSADYIESIKKRDYYWRHRLTAKAAFVTSENINELIQSTGFHNEVGIYHIDIDGNDYWIWKATTAINPVIVIVEYQSVFGVEKAITVPYKPDFFRTQEHHSNLYYGASLLALCDLAEEKGYYFVGCNSAGNNAYFVRKDKIGDLKPISAQEGYVMSKFREARDEKGNLLFLDGEERRMFIKGQKVYNTRSQQIEIL